MTVPYLDDGDVQIHVGDARASLELLPDQSVHAIATSPPFFGLRDYGTGTWEGGDDPDCRHERPPTTMNQGFNDRWGQGGGAARQERSSGGQWASTCPDCGAERVDRQIGLEPTVDEWAAQLVGVFREARRVLRDDGSLWIECGDSYASDVPYYAADNLNDRSARSRQKGTRPQQGGGIKGKDLFLAPMLLAVMLRADGWYLRGVYVWEKPDCMPESIEDRCTTSHSYVLHLAKSGDAVYWTHRDGRGARRRPEPDYRWIHRESRAEADAPPPAEDARQWKRVNLWKGRSYYFDRDAIREPFSDYSTGGDGGSYGSAADGARVWEGGSRGSGRYSRPQNHPEDDGHVQPTLDGDVPEAEARGADGRRVTTRTVGHASSDTYQEYGHDEGRERWPSAEGRSPRSVWRITTEASSFGLCPACRTYWDKGAPAKHCGVDVVAHFAVWPHELVRKIVDAATSEAGCCADCGAPRARVVNRDVSSPGGRTTNGQRGRTAERRGFDSRTQVDVQTVGWQPTCACAAATVPCTVMDVFGGSGTTARQARKMGRRAILLELNPDYAEISAHRTAQLGLLTT